MAMSPAKRRKGMAEKEVKRVSVKILKEGHTHEGKPCKEQRTTLFVLR